MSQDRFSNPKYVDWLKEKLCLQYAKEGLEPITERKVQTFHTNLSSRLPAPSSSSTSAVQTVCHTCVKTDLKKQWSRQRFSCFCGICDGWLDLLQQNHVDPTYAVEWDNFDVSQLPVSAWECAKVYLPYGSGKVQCAGDADLAAILTLYLNCRHFASGLQDVTLCEKVKDVRNRLLHSGTMKVEHAQMLLDVGVIKQLLNDPAFAAETSCQDAITKIDKLIRDKLELSQNKELELVVLNSDIKSVAIKTDQLKQDMDNLKGQVQQQYGQLGTEVCGLTTEVASMKDKLDNSNKEIMELHKVADLLCSFINACHIDKVDMGQLAVSISTLSTLRFEAGRQAEVVAQLQETVDRHEDKLEQHGWTLEQHERKLNIIESDIKAKRDRSDRDNQEMADLDDLQQYLIDLYKDDCVWNNPVRCSVEAEESVTISQMYVKPAMKVVRQKGQKVDLDKEQQRQVESKPVFLSYRHIFYTGTEQCKNIYVTGNAGMGKTTFCKQLVYSWCKAVQNISENGDSADDLSLLKEFKFLFYVNLRELESQYHIENMIRYNIFQNASKEYNVSDILKTDKCLVVLDGLDEWSRPQGATICRGLNKEIPGRNTMNKNCIYLTTTRNWKLCVVDLEWSKDYDKQVELCGIDVESSKKFADRIVDYFESNTTSVNPRPIDNFFKEVDEKELTSLTSVPILLIQMLTLWYFCRDLGKSRVQLYCRLLDLLFKQAKKHLPEDPNTENKLVQTDATLPECFTMENNCQTYAQLLLCLSKLAFMSLLTKDKEDSLVFNVSRLREYKIGLLEISLCLKCGMFTQDKGFCYPVRQFKKYSFLHKNLQEFFAAVYLVTCNDVEKNIGLVRDYCDKLDTTLEMGQMFMFVCGMNCEVGNQLLEHLTCVVSDDKRLINSRQSDFSHKGLLKGIQTCVMACVTEGASMDQIYKVCLQDYFIDYDTISHYINHVVEKKNTSIRSVYINTINCSVERVAVVLKHLQEVQTLEKLWLENFLYDLPGGKLDVVSFSSILASIITTNVRTLKSLCLFRVDLDQHDALFTAVLGCIPSLRALKLGQGLVLADGFILGGRVCMSHCHIEQLLASESHIIHLMLDLECSDHIWRRCRPVLNLSHHTQLQTLSLRNMCVTNLHVVANCIENVDMGEVTVAQSTLRQFFEALAQSSNRAKVKLQHVTFTEDSGDTAGLVAYLRGCGKFNVKKV